VVPESAVVPVLAVSVAAVADPVDSSCSTDVVALADGLVSAGVVSATSSNTALAATEAALACPTCLPLLSSAEAVPAKITMTANVRPTTARRNLGDSDDFFLEIIHPLLKRRGERALAIEHHEHGYRSPSIGPRSRAIDRRRFAEVGGTRCLLR